MNIPLNGRIAIIDDKTDQAIPLMRVLSKNQMPYVFYKGNDLSYLPENDERYNDIRLLFLDINLLNEGTRPDKKLLKSTLYSVLKKVISPDNFPYSLILWSRHQDENLDIVKDLFDEELEDRKPINIRKFVKSDYFPNFSDTEVENEIDLLKELEKLINSEAAYSYLINWENQIHLSADKTLQDIFSSYHTFTDWQNNANYILNKLGVAYLGKQFEVSNSKDKVISCLKSLNNVFNDTLENKVNLGVINNPEELIVTESAVNINSLHSINSKLLIANERDPIYYPGTLIEDLNKKNEKKFINLLSDSLKQLSKKNIDKEKEIQKSWKKVWLNVTPYCDMAQNKIDCHRLIRGLIVKAEYKSFFYNNEAIYTTPTFQCDSKSYTLVLNFRQFFTLESLNKSKFRRPLFRLRQQMIAEVQSKLSRHINRQGVLFLT